MDIRKALLIWGMYTAIVTIFVIILTGQINIYMSRISMGIGGIWSNMGWLSARIPEVLIMGIAGIVLIWGSTRKGVLGGH